MALTPEFTAAIGGHPVVAEILWRRGYREIEAARAFLDPNQYVPSSPHDLPDLDKAVARLQRAIAQREHIRIWGDFDVDGQTATSVLFLGLQACGAQVDYTIPNRSTHSHGLNFDGIGKAKDDGVAILLTCDCGVTDFEYVSYARQMGLDVIISDHHDLEHDETGAARIPAANATINPKRLPEGHPLMHLPGVGVAYELIIALMASDDEDNGMMGSGDDGNNKSSSPHHPQTLLDLVALGIVADIAYQQGDTRYLLQRGLQQLRSTPRPGIRALMRAAEITPEYFEAEAIGYQIGPRLNAAGRLETAELSVQLLTAPNDAAAKPLAERIELLNGERKLLQRQIEEQAFAQLAERPELARSAVIVLHAPDWPPSVIGVVANAIIDRYKRPAILISARPGELGRASARSVAGIDIHAAIAAQGHLIEGGGGHPMAAGFAIRSENVDAFREAVSAHVVAQMSGDAQPMDSLSPTLADAFEVAWRDVSLILIDELNRLAPFGAGNPRPNLVSRNLTFVRAEPLGQDGKHQMLYFQDQQGYMARAAWWRSTGRPLPAPNALVTLVYSVRKQMYQSRPRLQIEVIEVIEMIEVVDLLAKALIATQSTQSTQSASTSLANSAIASQFRILDLRHEKKTNRANALRRLIEEHGIAHVQVWAEGAAPDRQLDEIKKITGLELHNRTQLLSMSMLVIWSTPPGTVALKQALKSAQPQTVVLLCSGRHDSDTLEVFKQQMRALLNMSRARSDSTSDAAVIARMAARIGQRDDTLLAALACVQGESFVASDQLNYQLQETRAYRHYFVQAPADAVLRVE